jgi:hypothetical protein
VRCDAASVVFLTVKTLRTARVGREFDLITAGLICFNEYPSGATWSRPEWNSFWPISPLLSPGAACIWSSTNTANMARCGGTTNDAGAVQPFWCAQPEQIHLHSPARGVADVDMRVRDSVAAGTI